MLYASHCVKSVHIRSYSGPHFPIFRLNTVFRSKFRKNSFFNNTTNIYSLIEFADIDFLCILNLSEYYERITTYIFFCSLKSYKYLNATLLKTFAGNFIEFHLLLISLIRVFQFISSVKIPSTMVFFIITFAVCHKVYKHVFL